MSTAPPMMGTAHLFGTFTGYQCQDIQTRPGGQFFLVALFSSHSYKNTKCNTSCSQESKSVVFLNDSAWGLKPRSKNHEDSLNDAATITTALPLRNLFIRCSRFHKALMTRHTIRAITEMRGSDLLVSYRKLFIEYLLTAFTFSRTTRWYCS